MDVVHGHPTPFRWLRLRALTCLTTRREDWGRCEIRSGWASWAGCETRKKRPQARFTNLSIYKSWTNIHTNNLLVGGRRLDLVASWDGRSGVQIFQSRNFSLPCIQEKSILNNVPSPWIFRNMRPPKRLAVVSAWRNTPKQGTYNYTLPIIQVAVQPGIGSWTSNVYPHWITLASLQV